MTHFTVAQQRALAWLPTDGSWRWNPGYFCHGLWSLIDAHKALLDYRYCYDGWSIVLDYRLTEAGMAAARTLAEEVS